ncbi:multidrug effflux MFS transporter [Rugamonas sp. CCM 8940]|uniref:multidrug effflux MFS transporter n=1 Tax=Rugamonas sp. CCM 8940 TaxID=2765359 RepID=UPI0018F67FF1|nr:multidrug effflux MFS transporter [Rugamonas sp. CCM 8940]MBJ7314305.1 multidrug effflux MFS transporter [Rugamonas sp. CCM 8940]
MHQTEKQTRPAGRRAALAPWAWSVVLLLVVCLPRATIDAYLPSLPAMAAELGASDAQLQLTLTLYMVGYALSMLVCGPLADRYGRRPILLGGLALYLLASLVCAMAPSAPVMIAARMLQALGGCSGTVIGRVMVRDRFGARAQAGMLSRLSMGMALSPVLAPLLGSLIDAALGWRWVFIVLAGLAAGALLLIATLVPETAPRDAARVSLGEVGRIYAGLLRDAYFLRYALAISFVYCTYFPFIAESSVLLQRLMHLSPHAYALSFGLTVSAYLLGSQVFRRMVPRHGSDALIGCSAAISLCGSLLLLLATSRHPQALLALAGPMVLIMLSVGIAIPACQLAVLQPYAANAGSASGLFFFIQMAITALCSFAVGRLSDGTVRPMVWMTLLASAAFGVWWLACRRGLGARRRLAS